MRRRTVLAAVLFTVAGLALLAWSQRVWLLQHALGWQTDLRSPRAPNRPVQWAAGPQQPEAPPGERPPNVIVILADDLGINDVSFDGGGHAAWGAPTPNIDRLAREGAWFERGYAASAICTPSRAALLTGRYPWRFGLEFTPTPGAMARIADSLYAAPGRIHRIHVDRRVARTVPPFNDLGMPPSEVTLAERLRERGYHTMHIGKWHLGSTPAMRPGNQGFAETLFMESGLYLRRDDPRSVESVQDFDPIDRFLWPNMRWAVSKDGGGWFEPNGYLTDYFTDEAVAAIRANRHRPFFLYLAHWAVHTPLQATRDDYDALPQAPDHRRRVYASMVRSLDRSVGRVMQALADAGLDRDTLIVFTSDNGAPNYIGIPEVNRPYRGWKLTLFEGGIRVPYAIRWPARIAAGQRVAEPVSGIDLLPTVLAAAGAPPATDRPIDGVDLLGRLSTGQQPIAPRALHWRSGGYRAVIADGWKLISPGRPDREWLFDLAADPTERTDRFAEAPQRAAALRSAIEAHHAPMSPPAWPSFIEVPVTIDKTLDAPQAPDDVVTWWPN
jgi:arylsulfatase A-like enzyme